MKIYCTQSGRFLTIQNEVVQKYNIILNPESTCRMRTHSHPNKRMVCKWNPANTIQSTFSLFHEIGHIETTKSWMRRCESEYYATVWAIERCKEYGIDIPMSIIKKYQDYIDAELARGQRRHGSGYNVDLDLTKHL